jgi:predicted ABC-type ATPase
MSGPRPLAIIYAGFNGAGKSTLRRIEEGEGFEPRVAAIDADIAAREINPARPA